MGSLQPLDFSGLIAGISRELRAKSLSFMLIGGQAVLLHGRPRLTAAIDITLAADPSRLDDLLEVCAVLKLRALPEDIDSFVQQSFVLPALHDEKDIRVDFIFSTTPYEREAIDRAVTVELKGEPVPFATAEDLIVHKLFAGRAIDLEDAASVVRRKGSVLDWRYLRKWVGEFSQVPGREDLPDLLADLRKQLRDVADPIREFSADLLVAGVYADRRAMGEAAAGYVSNHLRQLLSDQDEVRLVVGSAPSQNEFFEFLTSPTNLGAVDWSRVVVFHMDEYVGLNADHRESFRSYQEKHFLSKIDVKAFHPIRGEVSDLDSECRRYTALLTEKPIDLVCLGIGENGHLAFNDPPADFDDPEWVKVVALDAACRQQQVNDGCFPTIDAVPTHAITLTLRVFQDAAKLSGVVPGPTKMHAVVAAIEDPISEECPATLLRTHPDARLFLDRDSASLLRGP